MLFGESLIMAIAPSNLGMTHPLI